MVEPTNREASDRGRRPRRPRERHPAGGLGLRELFDPHRLRRAMVRKGVRPAVLAVLMDQPMHGYQVITELEQRTGGRWRPSAGSVYPTLQQLEDEGLVRSEELDGRKVYTLTDAGRTAAEASPLTRHPLFNRDVGAQATDLRRLTMQLIGAAVQVTRVGSPQAQQAAREILVDTRRRLYRLLADDDADASAAAPAAPDDEEGTPA